MFAVIGGFIALVVLLSPFVILIWKVTGLDIGDVDDVRGVIALVFSFTTIGLAIGIVGAAVYISDSAEKNMKERFEEARAIIAVIIGVMGTIIGFYFGSGNDSSISTSPSIADLRVSPQVVTATEDFLVTGSISGGSAPYKWSLVASVPGGSQDKFDTLAFSNEDAMGTVISRQIASPEIETEVEAQIIVRVTDSSGSESSVVRSLRVVPGS
jgi:hypothetical protein